MSIYFNYPASGPGTAFTYSTLGTVCTTPTLDLEQPLAYGVLVHASFSAIGTASSVPSFSITRGTAATSIAAGSASLVSTATNVFSIRAVDTTATYPTFYQLTVTPAAGNAITVTNAVLNAQSTGE